MERYLVAAISNNPLTKERPDSHRDFVMLASDTGTFFAILCSAIVCFLIWNVLRIGTRPKDYPPGPLTLPIIGNLHQLPKKNIHLQYQQWARQYGPIFSLKLGQATTIVLADGYVIRELVDLRGGNYADRPHLWVRELFDDSRIIMRGYDDLWRVERKLYHSFLNIKIAQKYIPYQEFESLKLCIDLLHSPEDFVQHLGRMTGSIAASMAYGFRLPSKDSPEAHELLENSHGFFHCVVQSQMLDWYPSLRPLLSLIPRTWNPMATDALKAYSDERRVFRKYFDRGLQSTLPCFARDIEDARKNMDSESPGPHPLTEHSATYVAGIAFEGGADTTRYTLTGFIKAMAMFPDVQKKAQREIDKIVGEDELPDAQHLNQLPYINQVAKETVRWMPTAINGAIPHATVREDTYRGFRIPKGATIVLAVWSANHQEQDFPNPRDFRPERQVPDTSFFEASTTSSPKERGQWGFGSGRRICPGMHVARNTMLLAIVRILWAFDIRPQLDPAGNEVPIARDEMVGGLAATPAPFKCSITPRSPKRVQLLQREWETLSGRLLAPDGSYKENIVEL